MSISLEQLSDQCREILSEKSGADALESVRQVLEKVLVDDAFVAAHIGPQETAGRKVLFEDPDLGFTICAHARGNKAESPNVLKSQPLGQQVNLLEVNAGLEILGERHFQENIPGGTSVC